MRITLKSSGVPQYNKIMQGRNWIGRTYKRADGNWGAVIGKGEHVIAPTEQEAFRMVAVKQLGFDSVGELQEHNSRMRAQKKAVKAKAAVALNHLLEGNYEAFVDILEGK